MLIYKAMYKFIDQSVHAEVLDFPGTISLGRNLDEARRSLVSALADMAETSLLEGDLFHCQIHRALIQKQI